MSEDALDRLRTVSPSDQDGGLGADVAWAVAEIERLQAENANYEAMKEGVQQRIADLQAQNARQGAVYL